MPYWLDTGIVYLKDLVLATVGMMPGSPPLEENFGYVENIRKLWLCRKPLDCNDVPLAALQQSFKINCVPDIQQNPTYATAAREFFIL